MTKPKPEMFHYTDNIRIRPDHWNGDELWWTLEVRGPDTKNPHNWVDVQGGTKNSSLFWQLGCRDKMAAREKPYDQK